MVAAGLDRCDRASCNACESKESGVLTRAHSSGIVGWSNANERLRTQVLGGVGHISVGRRGECNAEVKDTEKAAL